MKITAVDVRCCQHSPGNFNTSAFRTGDFANFEFLVVTMKTDDGLEATAFGFAGRSARGRLTISVAEERLDGFVLALGAAGVAVRRLELLVSPLESMFFALSEGGRVDALAPEELADRAMAEARP